MDRIILFRYHTNPLICRDRVLRLRTLNPGVRIFGLYGGIEEEFGRFKRYLAPLLSHNYCIKRRCAYWKWKNSDLAVRQWYKDIGYEIEFDMLHIIEWDLLMFASLEEIYGHIKKDCLGLTALVRLKEVEEVWDWTSKEPRRGQWLELQRYARERYGYRGEPYASLGPGTCVPRSFLERFSSIEVPELSHDELRWPLFAQILDFRLLDNNFYGRDPGYYRLWYDSLNVDIHFNCDGILISRDNILRELRKPHGKRIFHPYRKKIDKVIDSQG